VDNERLIGDANELSLSRGRKGYQWGMRGSLALDLPRARLGFRAAAAVVVALPSSVWGAHCCWVGHFEENLQFSVLESFY